MNGRPYPRCGCQMRINTLSPHALIQTMRCGHCGYSEPATWADMARAQGIPEEKTEPPTLTFATGPNTRPIDGMMEVCSSD